MTYLLLWQLRPVFLTLLPVLLTVFYDKGCYS